MIEYIRLPPAKQVSRGFNHNRYPIEEVSSAALEGKEDRY